MLIAAGLLFAPVFSTAWSSAVAGAFLLEFLSGGRFAPLSWMTAAPTARALRLPGIAADVYRPRRTLCTVMRQDPRFCGSSLVLAHGLTEHGKDDPELRRAARLLARAGFTVAVPTITGLTSLRLRPSDVETVVRTISVMRPPVAVVGISVGAGPALIAAADARVRDRISAVLSLGGYASASELAAHYLTGDPQLLSIFVAANPELMDATARRAITTGRLDDLSPGLRATMDSLSPALVADQIRGRLLIVHGREDPLVPYTQSLRLADAAAASRPRIAIVGAVSHVAGAPRARIGDLARLWLVAYSLLSLR